MRKDKTVTIQAEGRDKGKVFFLTEKSAVQTEKWAARAIWAMGRAGIDIPEDVARGGVAAIMAIGLRALMSVSFVDAEPLLDEMLECVEFIPDPAIPLVKRGLIPDDIDEVSTLLFLRQEVVELHSGFSVRAALSKLGAAMKGEST